MLTWQLCYFLNLCDSCTAIMRIPAFTSLYQHTACLLQSRPLLSLQRSSSC
jgi:hypothetical protein